MTLKKIIRFKCNRENGNFNSISNSLERRCPTFHIYGPDTPASSLAVVGWGLRSHLAFSMFISSPPSPWWEVLEQKWKVMVFLLHISELGWKNNFLLKQMTAGNRTFLVTHLQKATSEAMQQSSQTMGKNTQSHWKQVRFFKQ